MRMLILVLLVLNLPYLSFAGNEVQVNPEKDNSSATKNDERLTDILPKLMDEIKVFNEKEVLYDDKTSREIIKEVHDNLEELLKLNNQLAQHHYKYNLDFIKMEKESRKIKDELNKKLEQEAHVLRVREAIVNAAIIHIAIYTFYYLLFIYLLYIVVIHFLPNFSVSWKIRRLNSHALGLRMKDSSSWDVAREYFGLMLGCLDEALWYSRNLTKNSVNSKFTFKSIEKAISLLTRSAYLFGLPKIDPDKSRLSQINQHFMSEKDEIRTAWEQLRNSEKNFETKVANATQQRIESEMNALSEQKEELDKKKADIAADNSKLEDEKAFIMAERDEISQLKREVEILQENANSRMEEAMRKLEEAAKKEENAMNMLRSVSSLDKSI